MNGDPFGDLFASQEPEESTQAQAAKETKAAPLPISSDVVIFDIETGPRPWAEIEGFYVPPDKPGEFDPKSVKLGRMKDPIKIRETIEAARQRHAEAAGDWDAMDAAAKVDFVDKAALSPITGEVVAIGYGLGESVKIDDTKEESILVGFWHLFNQTSKAGRRLIGFNIFGFDLPFLIRRSWFRGVDVPPGVLRENRYWHKCFVDLMLVWGCGMWGERISLDKLNQYLGGPRKNGDGAMFHKLLKGTAEEKAQAMEYLANDIAMTAEAARKLGVC